MLVSHTSTEILSFGPAFGGLSFALEIPALAEAGGNVLLTLHCRNESVEPAYLFGFSADYPRSLRVSPPKSHRPYIRVSFGDTNVLHPPEAFCPVGPGQTISTTLDLSFAFDRRGVGTWDVAFAYDPVKTSARLSAWHPGQHGAQTTVVSLPISAPRSLRDAGIDETVEEALDEMLLLNDPGLDSRLLELGPGGATFAARRFARVLSSGSDSFLGWRALEALERLREPGLEAVADARSNLPHAARAMTFARAYLSHRLGRPPAPLDLPFVHMLDRIIEEPDSRGNFLLSWSPIDSEIHGTTRLQLLGGGERLVTYRAPGEYQARTRRYSLSQLHMKTVAEALRYAPIWLLRPLRETGLHDEPRPAIEVQLALGDPFVTSISMWNGEWRHGPGRALASLLDRLYEPTAGKRSHRPSMG